MSLSKKPFVKVLNNSFIQDRITRLRNQDSPPQHFRHAIKELSTSLADAISNELPTKNIIVKTPLETTQGLEICDDQLLLASILRAGNGMLNSFLEIYHRAKVGFIGLERQHDLKIKQYYNKIPTIKNPFTVILDPMLASGHSAIAALDFLTTTNSNKIIYCSILSAPEGIDAIHSAHPDTLIYTASIDRELNKKGYILPGLGDAGDRIFNSFS